MCYKLSLENRDQRKWVEKDNRTVWYCKIAQLMYLEGMQNNRVGTWKLRADPTKRLRK